MPIPQRLLRISFLLACSAILLSAAPAALAQIPGGDVFFGYSRLGSDAFYPNVGGLNGWEAAAHFKVMPFIGLEGDVAHYGVGADAVIPQPVDQCFSWISAPQTIIFRCFPPKRRRCFRI